LLLLVAGFVVGLTVAGGGGAGDRGAANFQAALTTPAAVAQSQMAGELSFADVAEMVMPAVVNISTDKIVETGWQHPFFNDPWFRRFFNIPEGREDGGGRERIAHALGSGIIVSADGYILTNNHVIERASKIQVIMQDNVEYEAELIGADPQTEVALIKVDAETDLPFVTFGDSERLRIADEVMAIGNPFGLGHTVTKGIVSALGRSIGLIDYEDLIQTDATINPGNSGGALVNRRGEVVGMNTAILSRSGGSQGIGFAIPSNMANRIMVALREEGEVKRAWLGVNIQPVDHAMAEYYGLDRPRGVLISNVNEDTPAEKAGLREGDIILSVDGEATDSMSVLRNKISLSPVGHEAELVILRDGKEKKVTVELGLFDPEQVAAGIGRPDGEESEGIDGVTVRNLTESRRQRLGIPDDVDGVIVADVDPTSNAAREGLAAGDIILEIGREQVADLEDYRRLAKEDDDRPVLLRVLQSQTGRPTFMAVPR